MRNCSRCGQDFAPRIAGIAAHDIAAAVHNFQHIALLVFQVIICRSVVNQTEHVAAVVVDEPIDGIAGFFGKDSAAVQEILR